MKLTEAQENDLKLLKQYFPFRIVWGMIDKDTGEWSTMTATTMRSPRAMARKGHYVVTI